MVVPLILFISSSALAGYAYLRSGPVLSDLMLLALIIAAASLALMALRVFSWPARRKAAGLQKTPIVIDGSNVMHWRDETPQLALLLEVIALLVARGFAPGVVFDANAGYKLVGRYLGDRALARMLSLPEDRVLVVPKGTPADHYVLSAARDLGAQVVSNDRFRDWAEAHPEVREPGFVIRGGYRAGSLWLDEVAKVSA
jgi:hypothetical protein